MHQLALFNTIDNKPMADDRIRFYRGDAIAVLKRRLAAGDRWDYCLTSPPYYGQIDYGHEGQHGLEDSLDAYLDTQQQVFRLVYQGLAEGGVCWIVIGDTSNNYSPIRAKGQRRQAGDWLYRRSLEDDYREKEPLLVPIRLAERLRADGWVMRKILIWDKGQSSQVGKGDAPPETHEYVLMMGKSGKNGRPMLNTKPLRSSVLVHRPCGHSSHPCPFPDSLVHELLSSATVAGATVLDPYFGTGTTGRVASLLGMKSIGIDLGA
jgi:site-specific DNA-methyltransferase (adenine-specific)